MPRAKRYFLPGYVWHITHPAKLVWLDWARWKPTSFFCSKTS